MAGGIDASCECELCDWTDSRFDMERCGPCDDLGGRVDAYGNG